LRYTAAGKPVCNLSVATSNKYTSADGTKVEETIWWKVAVWGKQGENCAQYLAKGRTVYIEGRMSGTKTPNNSGGMNLNPTVFTTKAGIPAANFEITASFVKFVGGGNATAAPSSEQAPVSDDEWTGDQVPF